MNKLNLETRPVLDTSIVKNVVHLFIAENPQIGKPEAEEIKRVKMRLSEAVERIESGEITHSISCVLLLKAARKYKV